MTHTIDIGRGLLAMVPLALCVFAGCADIDDRPATWSYIHATIIQANCTSSNCHSELGATVGVVLSDKDTAYTELTGRTCDGQQILDHDFVVPYEPERSKLMYQLRGREVRSMPPDVPLPEAEIELVERWILEGAPCD